MNKAVFISLVLVSAAASAMSAGVLDKLPFFALSGEYSLRRGRLDFGNDHFQEQRKSNLLTTGATLGKRWRLSRNLRIQMAVNGSYGSVVDDTLPPVLLSDGTSPATLLRLRFFTGGILADFQYTFGVSPDGAWFFHGGGGGHVAKTEENETLLGDPAQQVNDDYLEDNLMYSGSVHAGTGFEIAVSPQFGFAVIYSLRYWRPIHYLMRRDFFPYAAADYRERFISHEVDVLFLVKRY